MEKMNYNKILLKILAVRNNIYTYRKYFFCICFFLQSHWIKNICLCRKLDLQKSVKISAEPIS